MLFNTPQHVSNEFCFTTPVFLNSEGPLDLSTNSPYSLKVVSKILRIVLCHFKVVLNLYSSSLNDFF